MKGSRVQSIITRLLHLRTTPVLNTTQRLKERLSLSLEKGKGIPYPQNDKEYQVSMNLASPNIQINNSMYAFTRI